MKTGKRLLSLVLAVLMLVPSCMIMSNAGSLLNAVDAGYWWETGNSVELWYVYGQPTYFSVPKTVTPLNSSNTYNVTSVSLGKYNSTVDLLETVDMSSASNLVTAGGFREFPALKTVIFSDSINSIGAGICEGCKELRNVDLPDNLTALLYNAFADCTSLSEIDLPEALTSIGAEAFSNTALETVTIPKSVENIETKDSYGLSSAIFKSCKSLTEINVDSENKYYSSEDGVLFNKSKTVLIRYPEGKTDKTYKVPDGVLEIAKNAFYECDNLEKIELSDSVLKIQDAFIGCDNLKDVVLSKNLEYIEESAFRSCPIERISVLPNSLIKVSSGAFSGHALTDVYFDGTEIEWNNIEEIVSYDYPNLGISGEIGAFYPEVTMHFNKDTSEDPENPETPQEPEHIHSFTSGIVLEATCEDDGIMSFLCKCGQSYTDIIPATGHKDENGDYKCDNEGCDYEFEKPAPETPEDPTENCDCNCHKKGISNFFFKIILFFQKLFKKNAVCSCGVAHY